VDDRKVEFALKIESAASASLAAQGAVTNPTVCYRARVRKPE